MLSFTLSQPAYLPKIPTTIEELGIPASVVSDLVLRRAFVQGTTTLSSLSESLKLSLPIIERVYREMYDMHFIDQRKMIGNDYYFALTSAGRTQATERFRLTRYAGPAPVSMKEYQRAVRSQSARVKIDRQTLRQALSDLVLPETLLDRLGPAIIAQNSMFLYGATGGGKTSIAERLLRVYQDVILVPYALEVDNQIIQLFDPVVHERVETFGEDIDPRWVSCKRPCVMAGGELTPQMLDLSLDETTGIYAAPLQLKANNGVLIIDDFGRQAMSPRELLNRWIVPLDRRVDYLMLRYGLKFQIPFEMLVVFSTNLEPSQLADEAFLRRIQNKVFVDNVAPEDFDEILRRVVNARNIPMEPGSDEYLRRLCTTYGSGELRACYPADICNILLSIANYEGVAPEINRETLYRATSLYFTKK